MEASIPSQYLLVLIGYANARGYATEALCEGTGISVEALINQGARVESGEADRVIANALRVMGDPTLGISVGQQLNLGAHAVVGQTLMACSDLQEVSDTLIRYGQLLTGSEASLSQYANTLTDRVGIKVLVESSSASTRFSYEVIFSAAQKTLSDLLQMPPPDLQADFPYHPPPNIAPFNEIFGDGVRFNAEEAILSWPRSLMNHPLPTSNETLRALYEAECARLLADLSDTASYSERTLTALDRLQGQYPQLDQMAAMLNLSARTYRRRLKEESTTFQMLLDKVRLKHAKYILSRGKPSIDKVALSLGFTDTSNFRRAFIHRTGESPSQWRKKRASRSEQHRA